MLGKVSRWVCSWIVWVCVSFFFYLFIYFFKHNGTVCHESGLPPCPLHLAFPVLPLELELDRQYCSGTHVLLAVPQWFSAQAVVWLDWADVHLHIICPSGILIVTSVFGLKIFGSCRPLGVCTCGQAPSGWEVKLVFHPTLSVFRAVVIFCNSPLSLRGFLYFHTK